MTARVRLQMTDVKAQPMPRTTTIVVDDQDDIRFLIRHLIELADGDLQVIAEAADGESCLRMLEGFPDSDPEVVVIDWMMPGLNGIETALRIRRTRPNARIILCSAFGDPTLEAEALEAGIDRFLSKERISEIPDTIKALTRAA